MKALIEREFAAAQRGRSVALVMFGFRDLAGFSERSGAVAADAAVMEFGRVLERMTRRMNLSVRCGWRVDAFLSVLSDADAAAAHVFVRRVLDAASQADVPMPAIDAGVAIYQPHLRSPEEFVTDAEHALAAARADSRLRVRTQTSAPPSLSRRTVDGLASIG